ncbi:MAG: hypothetical protein RJA35_1278 [Actinomycetota bacterium]|jgi:tight adherence protein C
MDDLTELLELICLCAEAGLSLGDSILRACAATEGPASGAFRKMLSQLPLGNSLQQALLNLARAAKDENLRAIAIVLNRASITGAPIGPLLRAEVNQLRADRLAKAREEAQKLSVKVLMPLLLCLMPATFIIVLGPALVQVLNALSLLG